MARRLALLIAGILAAVTALAGCSNGTPVSYAPAAYGETINSVGHCYYDSDPSEAVALISAGLCPATWIPTPMPLYWHEEYWSYYSSPAYYNTYVGASYRAVYISHETTFHATYSRQISAASAKAVYKGSNGKTVTGTTAKMKFSTGSGSTSKAGGGSLRGGSTGKTGTSKTGTTTKTTVRSGGSLRGGSRR